MYIPPQYRGIDVVQEIEALDDAIEFPKGLFGAILAPVGGEFGHNDAMRRGLQGKGEQDLFNIWPFSDDQVLPDPSEWFEWPSHRSWVLKSIQAALDLVPEVPVTRCEPVSKEM
jgi:hypothetical protein